MTTSNNQETSVVDFQAKVLDMIEQIGYEEVYKKLTEQSSIAKSGTKMEESVKIYQEMIGKEGVRRIDIINAMMSQQGISKDCAATYFQTIRTRLKKSTGQIEE